MPPVDESRSTRPPARFKHNDRAQILKEQGIHQLYDAIVNHPLGRVYPGWRAVLRENASSPSLNSDKHWQQYSSTALQLHPCIHGNETDCESEHSQSAGAPRSWNVLAMT